MSLCFPSCYPSSSRVELLPLLHLFRQPTDIDPERWSPECKCYRELLKTDDIPLLPPVQKYVPLKPDAEFGIIPNKMSQYLIGQNKRQFSKI